MSKGHYTIVVFWPLWKIWWSLMNDIIPRKFHFHFAVWGSWGIDGIKLGPGEIVIKDIYRKTIFCLEVTNLKLKCCQTITKDVCTHQVTLGSLGLGNPENCRLPPVPGGSTTSVVQVIFVLMFVCACLVHKKVQSKIQKPYFHSALQCIGYYEYHRNTKNKN